MSKSSQEEIEMKVNHSDNITLDEAKDALRRSGYLLETRIEQVLTERGYYVDTNSVYPDPITQVVREYDLQATKFHSLNERVGNWVRSHLFVECINNPQPIAFMMKESLHLDDQRYNIKLNGVPTTIKYNNAETSKKNRDEGRSLIEDYFEMQEYHHYCSKQAATQFCSFTKKRNQNEWMATHENVHFESFQKLCDVVGYYMAKTENDWKDNIKIVELHFFYPLIVVQGELLEVKVNKKQSFSLRKANHIQFTRTTMQNNEPTTYQIDLVTESYLPKYLEIVDSEMLVTSRKIKENIEVLNRAIEETFKQSTPIKIVGL